MIVTESEFVGRDAELARLRARLATLGTDGAGAVAVTGEAGMGKSRLVREAVTSYSGPVWAGRCTPGGTALRPWVEAVLAAVRDGADLEDRSVAPFLPALARLVPVAGTVAADSPSPLVTAEGVLRLLATASPAVMILEDIHWADPDSIEILDYLIDHAGEARLLIVVTMRSEEPVRIIRDATARRAVEPMSLGPLAEPAATALAAGCLGGSPLSAGLVELLGRHAEGRPFFIEETLAGLVEDGALHRVDGTWLLTANATVRVPATYAAWVAGRITGDGQRTAAILQAAAVLGREFDPDLLPAVTGTDQQSVNAALRTGERWQLLSPTAGDPHRLRFRHALGRDAVQSSLSSAQRARLAGAALDLLAGQPGREEQAAGLAIAAGRLPDAARHYTAAGRAAAERGALAAAVALLEDAADAAHGDLDATAVAEEALVDALALAGDAERALRVGYRLLRTLEAVRAPDDRTARARLAVARAAAASGQLSEAHALLDRVPRTPGESAARADALTALVALESGDTAAATAAAERAVEAADPAAACQGLEVLGRLARGHDLAAAARLFDRAEALAGRHGLRLWRARALHEAATVEFLTTLGVDGLRRARIAAVEAGAAGLLASIDLHLSAIHGVRFEAGDALTAGERSAEASLRLGLAGQAGFAWVCIAQAHAVAGRRRDTERAAARARELTSGAELEAYLWGQCLGLLSLVEEDRGRALGELARSMEYVRSGEPVSVAPYRVLWPLLATLDGAPVDGAAARAEAATPDVLTHTVARGLLAYAEAIAAGRAGDVIAADASFARGEAEFARLELPQGYHQLGRRLVAEAALADGWGEPVAWLTEARDWFAVRKMDVTVTACGSLLRRAGVPQRRRGRGDTTVPSELARVGVTAREADVLRLVALGLSNSDIAGRLYIAPRTVKTHVEHLLAKTGLSSRVQLAALALAEGIGRDG